MVNGAMVEGLDNNLVFVGDCSVTDVDQPIRGARKKNGWIGWVEIELRMSETSRLEYQKNELTSVTSSLWTSVYRMRGAEPTRASQIRMDAWCVSVSVPAAMAFPAAEQARDMRESPLPVNFSQRDQIECRPTSTNL